jgi:hypothetical protein
MAPRTHTRILPAEMDRHDPSFSCRSLDLFHPIPGHPTRPASTLSPSSPKNIYYRPSRRPHFQARAQANRLASCWLRSWFLSRAMRPRAIPDGQITTPAGHGASEVAKLSLCQSVPCVQGRARTAYRRRAAAPPGFTSPRSFTPAARAPIAAEALPPQVDASSRPSPARRKAMPRLAERSQGQQLNPPCMRHGEGTRRAMHCQ